MASKITSRIVFSKCSPYPADNYAFRKDIYKFINLKLEDTQLTLACWMGPNKRMILSCQPVSADVLSVMFGHRWLLLSCHLFTILKKQC